MAYFIFLKYLRSLEEFRKNPHVKIPPKSRCTNFQSLCIFKNPIFIQKEFPSDFGPSGPASHVLARFTPPATVHTLDPFGLSSLGAFAKRRLFFEFAQSGNDTFSLSYHCQVAPTRQLQPLPCAGRARPRRHLSSLPPTTPHRPTSSIETPIKAFTPPP
jgi:hypothetical protein